MTFHPWRLLRSQEWMTLGYHDLDLLDGAYFADIQTVMLRRGMLQVERRCTLAHELAHHHLGHAGCRDRKAAVLQEIEADAVASRWLIDVEALVRARLWSPDEHVQADELWVDVRMLRARRESLTRDERLYVQSRVCAAQGEWGAA